LKFAAIEQRLRVRFVGDDDLRVFRNGFVRPSESRQQIAACNRVDERLLRTGSRNADDKPA
jgi:hypothetical protein